MKGVSVAGSQSASWLACMPPQHLMAMAAAAGSTTPWHFQGHAVLRGFVLQVAPPAYLPVPGPKGRYVQGHGMAVVHTSLGTLTAFQPDGHVAWQVSCSYLVMLCASAASSD